MGLLGFDETMHVKLLAQCLIYSKVSMSDIIMGYLLLFQVILLSIGSFYTALGGEGNGTPLQYSHLENPMDRGAW